MKTLMEEVRDQSLHVAVAIGLYCLFTWQLPWWEAVFFVLLLAFVRECEQHEWDWRRVGRRDLIFFAIGAAFAALFIGG